MSSRDKILAALRSHPAPFDAAKPPPQAYLPVTRFDEADRLARFTAEAERRAAKVYTPPDTGAAIQTVLDLIGTDKRVVAWADLPLPDLADTLAAHQIEMVIPKARGDQRLAILEDAETIRVGITGAEAGFATTGTLALVTQKGQGRVASLLPPVYIALLPCERLVERLEDWFAGPGREALNWSRSVALVTGPSSTGDIEHHNVLGAHGPGTVHIIVF